MDPEPPTFKVASKTWLPWSAIINGSNGKVDVGGIMGSILWELAKHLNFKYEVVQPPDGVTGSPLPNGSFTGLVGMVQRGEADFSVGPVTITLARALAVDLSVPIYNGFLSIVTPRPTVDSDIKGFSKPFTEQVWMSIMLSLLAISVSLSIIAKVEAKLFNLQRKDGYLSETFLWAIEALAQESSPWLPKKDAGRMLVTVWLLASLIFMSSYSGILIAMLTAPKVRIPVDSIEDLVSQSDMLWRIKYPGSFSYTYLSTSELEVHKKAVHGSSGGIRSCWSSKEDLIAGRFAAICPDTIFKKVISWDFSTTGQCRLYVAQETVISSDLYTLAFRKNFELLDKANSVLLSLKESGLIEYWLSQQLKNTTQCLKPPSADNLGDGIAALNMKGLGGIFLVLTGGLLLSLLVFVGEMILVHGNLI